MHIAGLVDAALAVVTIFAGAYVTHKLLPGHRRYQENKARNKEKRRRRHPSGKDE